MPKENRPKLVEPVPIAPPPPGARVRRDARFAGPDEKKTRYSLPTSLQTASPVGYRKRVPFTGDEIRALLPLLALERPTAFADPRAIREQALFEECALGVMTSRQSTNFRGHRQITVGPEDSKRIAALLREATRGEAEVLDGASHTHLVLSRPYRTSFTALLTILGHHPLISPFTIAWRGLKKLVLPIDDIPTIKYLRQLHLGILADGMERAAVVASGGRRRAQVHMGPFCGPEAVAENAKIVEELEALCGISKVERLKGWRISIVTQVGEAIPEERLELGSELCRKLGANLLSFRSERIQPGVNAEEKAPPQYLERQDLHFPDELIVMAGRACYNAFAHWTGCDRERAKQLLLLERIDVLTPGGKERLREVREQLNGVTDRVAKAVPGWTNLITGGQIKRAVQRGRRAFALAGQRIYIGGLSRAEIDADAIEWDMALRGVGAAASRSGLVIELMGVLDLPDDCDLLAGVCLMAGPVNQNDVGKMFFGQDDLLRHAYPDRDPTSLLVWTMKAKTVADPIGNEEQLMNRKRKGALVELRSGPHEVVTVRTRNGQFRPMRKRDGEVNEERAFSDVGNFVTDPEGKPIPGNEGRSWPGRNRPVW